MMREQIRVSNKFRVTSTSVNAFVTQLSSLKRFQERVHKYPAHCSNPAERCLQSMPSPLSSSSQECNYVTTSTPDANFVTQFLHLDLSPVLASSDHTPEDCSGEPLFSKTENRPPSPQNSTPRSSRIAHFLTHRSFVHSPDCQLSAFIKGGCSPRSLCTPGDDGLGKRLRILEFSPQKLDHYETSATKSPIQAGSLHTPEQPEKLSPKANGHLKLSSLSPNDSRKQRDTDSSTTSDSSLNASHGTKNLEESVSILNDKGADVFAPVPPSNQQRKEQVITYPRFYFPQGVPVSMMENDAVLRRVCLFFRELPNEQCSLSDMARVCELTNLPMYWKHPIFMSLTKGESRCASLMDFTVWWRAMTSVAHDEAARFIYTLSYGSRSYLTREDLYGMIMDIMHTHPGLEFCREAVDFHDKYCDVVIARIMWNLGCVWRGKITSDSLRKSDLLEKIRQLQENVDINNCVRYFSYEHFYVIYCKFWEIDTNHDQIVSKADMRMHKDGAITDLVLNRIFSNAVRTSRKDTMNLIDFTNFLLAEEDKTHPTSLEYWFRVLDEDGDGVISMYEMERFHQAVVAKLKEEGIDSISFKDVVCQMLDMICPVNITSFQLSDLKKSPLSVRLLNALVNWRKFYAQEVTEGSERVLDETGRELSDWERFCSEEYETMMENEEEFDENFCVYLDDDEPHNATV